MSRPPKIPQYSPHKAAAKAVVKLTIDGNRRSIFLGQHGSDESRENYARLIADLIAGREITSPAAKTGEQTTPESTVSIGELI